MQVISLELEGIGPFAKRHRIDFQELGRSGLFLLEGPTGAGKSTILDAIVFALYGEVAGLDSSKDRIVSTLLPDGVEPFVDLVIDTSRGLLRVRRTPQYERPKRRGTGTTTQNATIKLWRLDAPDDPVGEPVSTRMDEANDELRRAIGLTREQFTQTVILPQGHFAAFLKANPDDRRKVLQEIFGTAHYERVQKKLDDLARELKRTSDEACHETVEAASVFCQIAWHDDALRASEPIPEQVAFDAARDDHDFETLIAMAADRFQRLGITLEAAERDAVEAEQRRSTADQALADLADRNGRIRERSDLLAKAAQLSAAGPAIERDAARLDAADRAEPARRPLRQAEQARTALEGAAERVRGALLAADDGPNADLASRDATVPTLRRLAADARRQAGALDHLVELESGLAARDTDLTLERERLEAARATHAEAQAATDRLRESIASRNDELTELDQLAADSGPAIQAEGEAGRVLAAAQQVVDLTERLHAARAAEGDREQQLRDAQRIHRDARTNWLNGLAGEVAQSLVEGESCPVCGSVEHPVPAARTPDAVDRDQLEELATEVTTAAQTLTKTQETTGHLAEQLAQQALLADGLDLSAAQARHTSAESRLREVARAVETARALRAQIGSDTRAVEKQDREFQEALVSLATRQGLSEAAARKLVADRDAVAAALDAFDSVRSRRSALGDRAELAEQIAGLVQAEATAAEQAKNRQTELTTVLAEHGFAGPTDAEAALLPELDRGALRAGIARHHQQVANVKHDLAADRLAGLDGATLVDEGPARELAATASAAAGEAHTWKGMAEQTVQSAKQASEALTKCATTLSGLRAEATPYLRMAAVAGGRDSEQLVTLPIWVLLRRFEEVVDLANIRLDAMSGGRYELRRTDEGEGRSRRQGLGLVVVDHHSNDTTRDPRTLSGGETFMAALALALGLADAVTAEAGGVELNTLFVDEGFGSLDEEALEAVLSQLSSLRAGGRSVGIVSHVAELKQRITERISVQRDGDGTSTLSCTNADLVLAG